MKTIPFGTPIRSPDVFVRARPLEPPALPLSAERGTFIFSATGKPWTPDGDGFSRLYRGGWPQGDMGWTVGSLIIQNLVLDQVQRITG